MPKRKVTIDKNVLTIQYELKPEYQTALFLIHGNEKIEFESRSDKHPFDVDGLEVKWKMCDELVEMGLLTEDEEHWNVYYTISELGEQVLTMIK